MDGIWKRLSLRIVIVAAVLSLIVDSGNFAFSGDAQWIWANKSRSGSIAEGETCHFRKLINLRVAAEGKIEIAADDTYVLFVNGKQVGSGQSSRNLDEYDITRHLVIGRNIVAVEAKNTSGNTAAVAARVSIRPTSGGQWFTFSSDSSWKASKRAEPTWQAVLFNDQVWEPANEFGLLGETAPWDRQENYYGRSIDRTCRAFPDSKRL